MAARPASPRLRDAGHLLCERRERADDDDCVSTISGNIPTCCALRSGDAVTVRFVEPRDAEALQNYFRSLTTRSRYNRFLGAASELPTSLLEQFIHVGEADRFSVVATMLVDGS